MKLIVTYTEVDPNIGGTTITSQIFEIDNPELERALVRPHQYCNVTLSYELPKT